MKNDKMLEKNELESWLFSVPKKSSLGDLVYKSKQLSGLDIFDKSKSSIKNMTDYHHKIINVFLQRVHNSLYDRKNIYKRVDMFQDEVYFKIGYKLLIDKMGLNVDGKQFKDLRYLESQIESLSGIFMKIRDNSTIDSFPIFSNILIDRDEEELYFAFNKEIIKAIVNNNRRIDCEDGSSPSYITLNITDLHTKNLSQSAMMLYEFLLANITNVTVNLNRYPIDEITSYISNRTNIKPSQVLEKIIIPSIQEIEDKLNLTVFYMCETYIKRNKLKNITFKVYTNDKYVPYEKSNKDEDGFEFINLDDLTTANIFRISSDEYKHCLENGLTNYDYKFVSEEYFGELVDWNMNHVEFRNNIIINKLMELIDRDNKVDMIDKFMKNDNYERYCSALNKFNLIPISKEMFDKGYRY